METDEDKLYHDMQRDLLQEVSLSFPHVGSTENTPISIPVPISTPVLSESSTLVLPESAD